MSSLILGHPKNYVNITSGKTFLSKFIDKLFIIACLFPFVSIIPTQTDVQPWAGVLALIVLFKNGLIFKKNELVLLILSIFSMFYIDFNHSIDFISISKLISLPYGLMVLIAFRQSKERLTPNLLNTVIIIYFIATLLTIAIPTPMIHLQQLLVRKVKVDDIMGARGVSVFATEPGLLAGLLVAIVLLNEYLYQSYNMRFKTYLSNFFMLIFCIAATKSGTGNFLFLLYIIHKFAHAKKKTLLITLLAPCIFLFFIFLYEFSFFDINRGVYLVNTLLQDPIRLLGDPSIMLRVYSLISGIIGMVYFPFGSGINQLGNHFLYIVNQFDFFKDFVFFQPYVDSHTISSKFALVSGLGTLLFQYGVFTILFVGYIYFYHSRAKLVYRLFSLIYLSVSYSIAFPMIWVLLALAE